MEKKKILILSMLSGFGHIRAGEALLDYAKENIKNAHVEHVDICNIDNAFKRYAKVYDFLIKRFPLVWKITYKYVPAYIAKKFVFMGSITRNKVIGYIKKENPDIIIFTNVTIIPIFINELKKILPKTKMSVLVTDYHAHPYYIFKNIDYYFVSHSKIKEDFVNMGVAPEKLVATGIPINPRFYIKQDILELKSKYGIDKTVPTVLLIASFRISKKKLVYLVRQLLDFETKINLIFIANGKQLIYNLIKNNFPNNKRLHIVNWTNTMEEYIKVSDVVISKAGGLTVSECLAIKKPMIIVNPIPGQEEHNAEFVQENNLGQKVKDIKEVMKVLPRFISKKNGENLVPGKNPSEEILKTLLK